MLCLADLGSNLRRITADGQVSESTYLPCTHSPRNVLQFMGNLSPSDLLGFVPTGQDQTLLASIVRQSLLLEYADAAARILNTNAAEPEYFTAASPGRQPDTLLWVLSQTTYVPPAGLPPPSGTLGDYIGAQVQTDAGRGAFPSLACVLDAVQHLANLSTAALDRVLTESLDICGYRLDAWATAVATVLLLRAREKDSKGIGLGVWSYVENLRPAAVQMLSQSDLAAVATATGTASASGTAPFPPARDATGFIFAPSLAHAATGAILRNGYLSNAAGTFGSPFAIDLSSTRVREALSLMEGMRQGQPLGALLGYLFEQGLNGASLQGLLQPFRNAYPIVANKMAQTGTGAADSVAASNVVDGAALEGAWQAGTISWGVAGLPASDGSDASYPVVTDLLDMLSDRVDALNDIALAESIYQVAKGNPVRSGGALNANSREQHLPDPQVVQTPRSGLDLTQRVLSLFAVTPGSSPSSPWLRAAPATQRSDAEPWLEQWLCGVLPDPTNVQLQLSCTLGGGVPATAALTLADIPMAALDLLSLAPPPPTGDCAQSLDGSEIAGTDLDRWILAQCAASKTLPPGTTAASIVYAPSPAPVPPQMTIPQLLVLVRSLQELIGAARAVTPADFVPPATAVPAADLDLSGIAARLGASCSALLKLETDLGTLISGLPTAPTPADGNEITAQLLVATQFGFPGAAPVTTRRDARSLSALAAQAGTISAAVHRRVTTLKVDSRLFDRNANGGKGSLVLGSVTASTPPTPKLAQDTAEAIFGPKFKVLPVITPTTGGSPADPVAVAVANLEAGLAAWPTNAGPVPAASVIQQLTHVRTPVARLDEALSLSSVLRDRPAADFAVAQMGGAVTYSPSNPWLGSAPVAARFPWTLGSPPQSLLGSYAMLVWTPADLGAATGPSMCGLFFDEWVEQISSDAEKVAVSLHHQEPGARAPQSMLLAVAPPDLEFWSAKALQETVLEAMAQAKIRTVDPMTLEYGGKVGQLLPAIFAGWGPYTVSSTIPILPTGVDPPTS